MSPLLHFRFQISDLLLGDLQPGLYEKDRAIVILQRTVKTLEGRLKCWQKLKGTIDGDGFACVIRLDWLPRLPIKRDYR